MTLGEASLATLSRYVDRPPFRTQIAFAGDWMRAWRFGQDAVPSSAAVCDALAGRGTDVAVEFCFELSTGKNFFFGQRRLGGSDDPRTVDFVNRALACGREHDWTGFPDFLSRLRRVTPEIEQGDELHLCRDLDNIEVGITDWWRRGDVVEVWNARSNAVPDIGRLREQLLDHPSLVKNDINFICLEFNFPWPIHHWFGVEISKLKDGVHTIQIPEAFKWLTDCLERPIRG